MIEPLAFLALTLADQPPGDLGAYGPLINLGAVGVICAVLITFAKTTVADLRKQRDEAQEDLAELNREVRGQMIPAMVEANRTMTRIIAILDERRP